MESNQNHKRVMTIAIKVYVCVVKRERERDDGPCAHRMQFIRVAQTAYGPHEPNTNQ